MKNKLIAYQGGGYDGCIWEWNYALYDKEGKFHDIHSSGSMGCETEEELKRALEDPTNKSYIYDLTQKGYDEFVENHNEGTVVGMTDKLNSEYGYNLTLKCDICKESVPKGHAENLRGCGGIMIEATLKVCEDCYASHSCAHCGEFWEDIEQFSKEGLCEYCREDKAAEVAK